MKTRLLLFVLVIALSLGLTSSVSAQTYYFSVDREVVDVTWNSNGTASIRYTIVFTNSNSADAMDYVDIGIPTDSYNLSDVTAEIDGVTIADISYSPYVSPGVALGLQGFAIGPGESGTVTVFIRNVGNVLFTDDEKADYASAKFSPNWFGSEYTYGTTDLTVNFILPPGVTAENGVYHYPSSNWPGAREPEAFLDGEGRVVYSWHSPDANGYTQYTFGASFPANLVPTDAVRSPSMADRFGMTAEDFFDMVFGLGCFGFVGFMIFGMPILAVIGDRKRRMQYLPPKISIEGHGVKRGLTAVEAAVLLETPLDKVMTMILFAVVKKGAAQVEKKDPLTLSVANPLPEGLRGYETQFLEAFAGGQTKSQQRRALQTMTVDLIKSVGEKMKGFSRKETVDYYKAINDKAWQQIAAAGTPEVQSKMFDEALEWTMLDKNYDDRTRDIFQNRPVYVPMWWGRYDPVYRGGGINLGGGSGGQMSSGGAPNINLPSLPGGDFAASVVTGVQNFSQDIIGDLGSFTSGVTEKTNPVPVVRSTGGGRSGGGCACACACAGCACACAGGGR